MKKIAVFILAALFVASTIPAFAGEQPKKERNLFVIIKNSIKPWKVKPKNELKNPLPTVSGFQNVANGIKEGSAKAKNETLRTETAK
ncbi:MAG: hypothetical protein NTZ95_03465 [Candidatus Omnitrophica bacterium]|nr:hypothetical protein [Candidatus Omnitrophota bacterium]